MKLIMRRPGMNRRERPTINAPNEILLGTMACNDKRINTCISIYQCWLCGCRISRVAQGPKVRKMALFLQKFSEADSQF